MEHAEFVERCQESQLQLKKKRIRDTLSERRITFKEKPMRQTKSDTTHQSRASNRPYPQPTTSSDNAPSVRQNGTKKKQRRKRIHTPGTIYLPPGKKDTTLGYTDPRYYIDRIHICTKQDIRLLKAKLPYRELKNLYTHFEIRVPIRWARARQKYRDALHPTTGDAGIELTDRTMKPAIVIEFEKSESGNVLLEQIWVRPGDQDEDMVQLQLMAEKIRDTILPILTVAHK